MKTITFILALLLACGASAATTTRNDDSCDIAVLPAATLLLPYFEVDLDDGSQTTLLTITNVTNTDAVARITLWTDRGYPVFSFSVFLTGYDVQSLSLYDILGRGVIAHDAAPRGEFSDPNPAIGFCDVVPRISEEALARIQSALTAGKLLDDTCHIGSVHENAVVTPRSTSSAPRLQHSRGFEYWLADLRFDNILTGDYRSTACGARAGRAAPHPRDPRGPPSSARASNARSTRATRRRCASRPAQFAARWTSDTSLKIWRSRAGIDASCDDYADTNFAVADVTFDDQKTHGAKAASSFPRRRRRASAIRAFRARERHRAAGCTSTRPQPPRQSRARRGHLIDAERRDAIALANGCAAPVETRAKITPSSDDSCDIALLPAATLLLPH
jgi:hypothetical protein